MSSSDSPSTSAPTTPDVEIVEAKKAKITSFFKKSGRVIGPTKEQSEKIARSYEKQAFRIYSAPTRAKKWRLNKQTEQFLEKETTNAASDTAGVSPAETANRTPTSSRDMAANVRIIRNPRQDKLPQTPSKVPISPVRVEKSERRYKCAYCSELFKSQSAATRHTNKKHETMGIQYRCRIPGCGQTFGRKDRLHAHEGTHTAPITCPLDLCGATFANAFNADRHVREVHGPAWACTLDGCLKAVSGQRMTREGILKHMRGHKMKGHYAHLSHEPEPRELSPMTPEDIKMLQKALTGHEYTDGSIRVDESPEDGKDAANVVPESADDIDREGEEPEPLDNPEQAGEAVYQEMLMLIEHQAKEALPEPEILQRNQLFMAAGKIHPQ